MTKLKSTKAVSKRFKVTASGLLKRGRAGKRHLLSDKSSKRKRHLNRPGLVPKSLLKTYKRMMCV